jgi:hypothetical protein
MLEQIESLAHVVAAQLVRIADLRAQVRVRLHEPQKYSSMASMGAIGPRFNGIVPVRLR